MRSFFEVAEGAAFGEGAVEFGADGGEDVHLHGFGDGEGGGVFLAPDVAVVKGGAVAFGAEVGEGFAGRGAGFGRAQASSVAAPWPLAV